MNIAKEELSVGSGKKITGLKAENFVAPKIITCPNCNAIIKYRAVFGRIYCPKCKKIFKVGKFIYW